MTHPLKHYAFEQLRSYDDEPAFFALMGRFFASANVRRDCGGYPSATARAISGSSSEDTPASACWVSSASNS
ncbi:hypothetical protein WJ971_12965 [Achromobacter xylosoxidans]